ncbi:neuromedin-U isoform X1 [Erpetoichthys calabaricus]|uniref:Neuromedin U n=2 Tax=Polypteridae TaxID=8289 RepID=A0A8C4SGX7_ERPCA|nr:neuromedin-U isoform X1 [Erpetoichthys calabaricus]
MLSFSYCQHRCAESRGGRSSQCTLTFAALLLLVSALPACRGVPVLSPQGLQGEQEMQDWNEIEDVCSSFLSVDSQSQASSALDELCYLLMGIVHKTQDTKPKDHAKRFLFHYSKTHDSGNSDIVSSVLHPLLQLVPQLHVRRMRRFRSDDDLQGPAGIQSRGYFLFRPRNGRRSTVLS